MKTKFLFIFFFITLAGVSAQPPKTFLIDANRLVELKKKVRQKDKSILPLVDSLRKQADALLTMKPVSVMDKAFTPPGGDKHDYMSQAPYFWYDSSKPNGLPYLRRDGERNPEIYKITDHSNLDKLGSATRTLALASYLTGSEKYAKKASDLLHYWFLEPDTRMNPNLEYAQAVPGINTGRGIGIIETRALTNIVDAVGMLEPSKAWIAGDTKRMQQWYWKYLNWMLTSKNGIEENRAKNNHGTWFAVQALDFALFVDDRAAKQISQYAKARLDSQLTKEGTFPLELARTNALGYSTFNTRAWFELATLTERMGIDLWHYENASGATLKTALDWLLPFALGEKKWEYQQIGHYNKTDIYPLLFIAADKFGDSRYLKQVNGKTDWMTELLYKK